MEEENKPTFFKEFEQVKQLLIDLKLSNSNSEIIEKTNLFRKIVKTKKKLKIFFDNRWTFIKSNVN